MCCILLNVYFVLKTHQNVFGSRAASGPARELKCSPDPPAGLRGWTRRRDRQGRIGREGEGGEGRGR